MLKSLLNKTYLTKCYKKHPKDDPPGSPKFFKLHHTIVNLQHNDFMIFINESIGNMTNNDTMFNSCSYI